VNLWWFALRRLLLPASLLLGSQLGLGQRSGVRTGLQAQQGLQGLSSPLHKLIYLLGSAGDKQS